MLWRLLLLLLIVGPEVRRRLVLMRRKLNRRRQRMMRLKPLRWLFHNHLPPQLPRLQPQLLNDHLFPHIILLYSNIRFECVLRSHLFRTFC